MPIPNAAITRQANVQFATVMSTYWISFFSIAGFTVVLLQSKNFTDSEIGILLALQSFASIISQPIISGFAGKNPHIPLKRIIAVLLFAAAVIVSILYFLPHIFLLGALIFVFIGMTQMSAPSLMNAVAMQLTNAGIPINYGAARGIGSLSFAVAGLLLGKLVDISGINTIIPVFVIFALITGFLMLRLRKPEMPADPTKLDLIQTSVLPKQSSLFAFLKNNRAYTGFCIASVFLFGSHACINSFLPNIMDSLGGSLTDQGITRSLAASVELPIMFFYSVLATRINTHKLLIVSAFSFFLKALATLLVPSIGFLFAIQILQMPAFGLYAPTAVHFSDHSVSDADRIRSQAIAMVAGIGMGNVIGNLGGGFVLDIWGLDRLLLLSTVLAAIGCTIMFIVLYEKSPRQALV